MLENPCFWQETIRNAATRKVRMSFLETHARFRRLLDEQAAWKLLRADSAPLVLAFVADLFKDASEVPFGQAKTVLEAELVRFREEGLWEAQDGAGAYLRRWIQAGWLRELDDGLSMTDACEVALRFCRGLDQRDAHSTASHLRVVQDAVRDLAASLSPSPEKRMALLEARKEELQREIDELQAGVLRELSDDEQRERIREVYQLASVLDADFRRIEDDIRELDQALRVQMIRSSANRGEVLRSLLGQENLLARSDAGRAFTGFFRLLMDDNRSTELREQLRSIMSRPAARFLSDRQQRFLNRLMRELGRESDRVLNVRRRTEEGLRAFVESGAMNESRAVERLLGSLERTAVRLRDADVNLRSRLDFSLASGLPRIQTVDRMRLRLPEEQIDTSKVEMNENARSPSDAVIEQLHAVKTMDVAKGMCDALNRRGPMTIGGLLDATPIHAGLEELVTQLRVAKAIGATEFEEKERVLVTDRQGHAITATIPRLMLHAELFPSRLEDLTL
jgi:hypothetical protein